MLETPTIAACVLALSAPVALTRDVGTTSANVGQTGDSRSTSSSILEQRLKQQSAAGSWAPAYNTSVPSGYRR
jgi:hypothetical protein